MIYSDLNKVIKSIKLISSSLGESCMQPSKEEIESLIENAGEGCGPEGDGDEVDNAIQQTIELLLKCNYEESSAMEAVYDGLASLIEEDQIPDTPLSSDHHEKKLAWADQFNGKIKNKLISMGLDLAEG